MCLVVSCSQTENLGDGDDVVIAPQIPSHWQNVSFRRKLRGAEFEVSFNRSASVFERRINVNNQVLEGPTLPRLSPENATGLSLPTLYHKARKRPYSGGYRPE